MLRSRLPYINSLVTNSRNGLCVLVDLILRPLLVFYPNVGEHHPYSLADWSQTAVDERSEEFLSASQVDHADPETGRHLPDVVEGDEGELAPPAERQRDGAQEREQDVAAVLGAREALVRVPPDAVGAVAAFRFADHILEQDLEGQDVPV